MSRLGKTSNINLVLQDDGLFIRQGTAKFRPEKPVQGLRKGATVKAWPWSGGIKVELSPGIANVWPKDA